MSIFKLKVIKGAVWFSWIKNEYHPELDNRTLHPFCREGWHVLFYTPDRCFIMLVGFMMCKLGRAKLHLPGINSLNISSQSCRNRNLLDIKKAEVKKEPWFTVWRSMYFRPCWEYTEVFTKPTASPATDDLFSVSPSLGQVWQNNSFPRRLSMEAKSKSLRWREAREFCEWWMQVSACSSWFPVVRAAPSLFIFFPLACHVRSGLAPHTEETAKLRLFLPVPAISSSQIPIINPLFYSIPSGSASLIDP